MDERAAHQPTADTGIAPTSRSSRRLYYCIAVLMVGIGSAGTVVPLLPTTPFILVAGWAAARGNPRLHRWLRNHPRFGPFLRDWNREKAIARRTKVRMITLIILSWIVLLILFDRLIVPAVAGACMATVALVLATRPRPSYETGGAGSTRGAAAVGGAVPNSGAASTVGAVPMGSAPTGEAHEAGRHPFALRVPLGIGTMLWGNTPLDRRINDRILSDETLGAIRARAFAAGVRFVDTAEGYGGGTCEQRVRRAGFCSGDTLVATKFLPTLWRWSERSVPRAIRRSNRRLGVRKSYIVYIHTPIHPRAPDVWIRGAARAVREGLVDHIGVSNFNARQVSRAAEVAAREGCTISSNQIMFNPLVYGSSLLQACIARCRELGVTVVGFGSVGQGLLADGLTRERTSSIRLARIAGVTYDDLAPLRETLASIAETHRRSMAQVCIQWAIAKGVIPLVGTRSVDQLENSIGGTGFSLSAEEIDRIDRQSLAHSTFNRSRRRRAAFALFISLLMTAYRVSRAFA